MSLPNRTSKKVVVIGGGASGFFSAINIAQKEPDYEVIILEKTKKLLSKVLVSGGGRCNVTHACFDNTQLVKHYPRGEKELRSVFSRFSTTDVIQWFKERGVNLKTEADGRMFPDTNTSTTIANCLLNEAKAAAISVKTSTHVTAIETTQKGFALTLSNDKIINCDSLVIATGGNPKEEGYSWIKNLNHSINKPVPSLFTFKTPNNPITELMGVSVPLAHVKVAKTKLATTGPLLITHWGFSGPAILKNSAWGARILNDLDYHFTLLISWIPNTKEDELRTIINDTKIKMGNKTIFKNRLFDLPKRLWEYQLNKSGINETTKWADLSKKQSNQLINSLLNDEYNVNGKTTFKEEFVTCGGVPLKEINLKSMESKKTPHVYFAGEVIDVDGITGGFNFQNAWSTAWIVAQNC